MSVVPVGWGEWLYCTEICTGDTSTPHSRDQWSSLHGAGFLTYSGQLQNIWEAQKTNKMSAESPRKFRFCWAVTHFCQHVACMTCPQLPVWVPSARYGDINSGYGPTPLRHNKNAAFSPWNNRLFVPEVTQHWPSALLTGIFPLHCVNTVDLWTHAVSTIAWALAPTSCSSWQRMQVSTSLSAGVEPLCGPMATHRSICAIAQLEESKQTKVGQTQVLDLISCQLMPFLNRPTSPLRSWSGLSLWSTLGHVFIKHLVGLNKVFLHCWHLGHDFLAVEFGCLCLSLALSFFFVLRTL